MKKLSYIILGFIAGAALTYYFCPRSFETDSMKTKFKTAEEVIKPEGLILQEDAEMLNNNWTEYREAAVDSAARKQGREKDDRWTEWSVDEIQNYLWYAQWESYRKGYKMTSIRVYLGVYGDDAPANKKNLTTMFMAPRGVKSKKDKAEASMNPFSLTQEETNIPVSPLNNGHGGSGGYP